MNLEMLGIQLDSASMSPEANAPFGDKIPKIKRLCKRSHGVYASSEDYIIQLPATASQEKYAIKTEESWRWHVHSLRLPE